MNEPAWAFSNLCIGRSYDANKNRAGVDLFQPDIHIKTQDVNTFSFRYKIIKSNEDVRDLLNISGNISLKIKGNILKVEGAGKYISNTKNDEETTEILAVMKCTTVNETMDGSATAKPEMEKARSLGTHYVRSVTYGAEMIASLKFKSSSSSKRKTINGKIEGSFGIQGVINPGLEAQLKKLSSECNSASDLSIEYYATDLPDKNPTNLEDLVKLIQQFPSRLKKINGGKGVPIQYELQSIANVFPALDEDHNVRALEGEINEIESRYDDLYLAKRLVATYRDTEHDLDKEMREFNSEITKTLRIFSSAISTLDEERVKKCLQEYADSLDGNDEEGKFVRHWRDLLKKKVPSTDIKLPRGKDLTIAHVGETDFLMNVPAWAFSNLCIGRSYDANKNRAGVDLFQPDIHIKTQEVNTFSFRYKTIKSNKDVRDLLNISGDISLKIKADILKAEGAGKYISNSKKEEETTEVLAVMKCTTVKETMDGSATTKPEMEKALSLGTHFVRSVTYGAEMVASLKFKSSSSSKRKTISGKIEGSFGIQGVVNPGLEAQLKNLSSECDSASDLSIEYYATDLPDKNSTNLEELVKFIQEFPSRLKKINEGKGVPIQYELQSIANVFPALDQDHNVRALECEINEIESRYDDLYLAKCLVATYRDTEHDLDKEMREFNSEITKTLRIFSSAISTLDEERVKNCLQEYAVSLDGNDEEGKFVRHWRDLLKKKVPSTNIKLPGGKDLTVALVGKTGSGKSATANRIVGYNHFESTTSASSVTKICAKGSRKEERKVKVIDTPGVLDTSSVKMLKSKTLRSQSRQTQRQILKEVYRIFKMAPDGFDAIILVVKYGVSLTEEDKTALNLLQTFLGKESTKSMILILTWGDQALLHARDNDITQEDCTKNWIGTLPEWMKEFIAEINQRWVLFDNCLKEAENPEACKKQLSELIEVIDKMNEGSGPLIHPLCKASDKDIEKRIKKALDDSGFESDGCFPESATVVVKNGFRKTMDSLRSGEYIQVIDNGEICFEPVITFIHRQPEVLQEFLSITTATNKNLKITEDHLLFVKRKGRAIAIPARDTETGDTLYVRGNNILTTDTVQAIISVYEKGVYAPVTLSGTILVNDVHASCYFDVLSHEWSHRAMGAARAIYHVSPWMVEWISGVGEKNGFPGWCRVAHKMLTWLE